MFLRTTTRWRTWKATCIVAYMWAALFASALREEEERRERKKNKQTKKEAFGISMSVVKWVERRGVQPSFIVWCKGKYLESRELFFFCFCLLACLLKLRLSFVTSLSLFFCFCFSYISHRWRTHEVATAYSSFCTVLLKTKKKATYHSALIIENIKILRKKQLHMLTVLK